MRTFIVTAQSGANMRIVTRTEVATPEAKCVKCTVRTRSHVLELAKYEEYEETIEDDKLEDFQGRKKDDEEEEEPEVVIKYDLITDAVVICHKCWVVVREDTCKSLDGNIQQWLDSPMDNLVNIKKFLKKWNQYEFSSETADQDSLITSLRAAVKEAIASE